MKSIPKLFRSSPARSNKIVFIIIITILFLLTSYLFSSHLTLFTPKDNLKVAHAVSEGDVIYDDEGLPVTLPTQVVRPDKNQYVLSIKFDYIDVSGTWTNFQTVEYSTNYGLTYVEIAKLSNTGTYIAFTNLFYDLLATEVYNNTQYTLYTDDGKVPTIKLNGAVCTETTNEAVVLNLAFNDGSAYYLEGRIGFVVRSTASKFEAFGTNIYNNAYYVKNGTSYKLLTDAEISKPAIGATLFSSIVIGYGSEYGSGVGVSSTQITWQNSMADVFGGINLVVFSGQWGVKGNEAGLGAHSTICLHGTNIRVNTVSVQEAGVVLNASNRDAILINSSSQVSIFPGGLIERSTNGPAIITYSATNTTAAAPFRAMFFLMGGTLRSTGGSAIEFGQNDKWIGYVVIVAGSIESGNAVSDSTVIAVGGLIKLIMLGGLIRNDASSGSAIYNGGAGTVDIRGGTIITNSSNPAVVNSGSGTINIGPDVTINNEGTGEAIVNTGNGAVNIDAGATITGDIEDAPTSSSVISLNILDGTEHRTVILSDYNRYVVTDSIEILETKFIQDNPNYSLHFDTQAKRIYAIIKVLYKKYNTLEAPFYTKESITIPYDSVYPIEISDQIKGFTPKYYAIDPVVERNTEKMKINPGSDYIRYTIPHEIDCTLELNTQVISSKENNILANIDESYSSQTTYSFAGRINPANSTNLAESNDIYAKWSWGIEHDLGYDSIGLENEGAVAFSGSDSLLRANVKDSGVYKLNLEITLTRYGIEFTQESSAYINVIIRPVVLLETEILYKYSDDLLGTYGRDTLKDRLALAVPYTLSFDITHAGYTLVSSSYGDYVRPPDYSLVHEGNTYSGKAKVSLTLSENFTTISGQQEIFYFNIKIDEITHIGVVYIDDINKDRYKREYDAYESLSLDSIRVIAYYANTPARELQFSDVEILYERYTDIETNTIDYTSRDGFFALRSGASSSVKLVYLNKSVIFPSVEDGDTLLTVNKLDTGVYMYVPQNSALTSEALAKYSNNPNKIPGRFEFNPATIVTNAVYYSWSFYPDDNINYVTLENEQLIISPIEATATGISIEGNGVFRFTAFEHFIINNVTVWLNYADNIDSVDVTSNARVLYYHGKSALAETIENSFYSKTDAEIALLESGCFLADDRFVVIMYTPWDNNILDYGTPFFSAFALSSPVTKIKPDTSLNTSIPLYTTTVLNDIFLKQENLLLWDVVWTQSEQVVVNPLSGTWYYNYTFTPIDTNNYELEHSEVWLTAQAITVTSLDILSLPSNLNYTAQDTLPSVSQLIIDGLVINATYTDGSEKIATEFDLVFEYGYISSSDQNIYSDFIGKHTFFIARSTVNTNIKINIPITITLQHYAEINFISDLINGETTFDNTSKIPRVASDSIFNTTANYDEKGLNINYYMADQMGSFLYGSGAQRKFYRLIPDISIAGIDVGTYEILYFYIGQENYFHVPTPVIITFNISEYNPWGTSYSPLSSPPTVSSPTHNLGYWDMAAMPSLFAPASFDTYDATIIDAENGAYFYWTLGAARVSSLDAGGKQLTSVNVTYTWHWERPNYTSQSGGLVLEIYQNVLKKLYAEFSNGSKVYNARDVIDLTNDGISVYGIYEDNEKYPLPASSFTIIYNGGFSDGITVSSGSGKSGGTTPTFSQSSLYLNGDHTMIGIIPAGNIMGLGVLNFSLFVEVKKLNYATPVYSDLSTIIEPDITYYPNTAQYVPQLNATYHLYKYADDGIDHSSEGIFFEGTQVNDPFRGWYVPLIPISAAGTYKCLVTFNIIDPSNARDYEIPAPIHMSLGILYNCDTVVSLDQSLITTSKFYYGDTVSTDILNEINLNTNHSSFTINGVTVPGSFRFNETYFRFASTDQTNNFKVSYQWIWTPSSALVGSSANTYDSLYMPVEGSVYLSVVAPDSGRYTTLNLNIVNTQRGGSGFIIVQSGSSIDDVISSVYLAYADGTWRLLDGWVSSVTSIEQDPSLSDAFLKRLVEFSYSFPTNANLPELYTSETFEVKLIENPVDIYTNLERVYSGSPIEIKDALSGFSEEYLLYYGTLENDITYTDLTTLINTVNLCFSVPIYLKVEIDRHHEVFNKLIYLSIYTEVTLSTDGDCDTNVIRYYGAANSTFTTPSSSLAHNEFLGWFTTPTGVSGGVKFSDTTGTLLSAWVDRVPFSIYARFTPNKHTVTFSPNNKNVDDAEVVYPRTIVYGSTITLLREAWYDASSTDNFYIKGWTTVSGGQEVEYLTGYSFTVVDDIEFFAVWDFATYNISTYFGEELYNQETYRRDQSDSITLPTLNATDQESTRPNLKTF
ncbi:MAG: hypothetical protein LBU04_00165, partial [Christensenellaceae bacterium]|nr:hypothetical protein [Christensenellaceae bacterium]